MATDAALSVARSTRFAATTELPIFYTNASILVELVRGELESQALRTFLDAADTMAPGG
jgi:hypothetical protein